MKLEEVIEKLSKDGQANAKLVDGYLDDFIPNQLLKSENLQQAFGISDKEMQVFYAQGYLDYQKGNFPKAAKSFEAMLALSPFTKKYWMGFSASMQLWKKYDRALKGYAMLALLDTENPYPHFHAYECYMAKRNTREAKKALKTAFEKVSDKYSSLKSEIERIKREKKWL